MRFRLFLAIVMAVSLTAAACTSSSAEISTTTTTAEVAAQTVTTEVVTETVAAIVATETTTVSPEVNLATAEAVVAAMSEPGEEALDGFPWSDPQGYPKKDVVEVALFDQALHIEVLDVSCDVADPQLVQCQAHTTDDLTDALGGGVVTATYEFSFNDSGEITGFVAETQDGGVGETFTNWAWNIAYPGICESPAQCASALLDVVDEYYETYPGATMASYVTVYNSGDIDEIMAFFSDESVITGYPYPVEGRGLDGIRELHVVDRQAAAVEDPFMISNLEVADDTVTWNQIWVSSTGQEYCHEGQSAVVKDRIILFWDWSSGSNCA